GLVTNAGDAWLEQRRTLQPFFHKNRHEHLARMIRQAVSTELSYWERVMRQGTPFDLSQALERMSMEMMVQTVFGIVVEEQKLEAIRQRLGFLSDYRYILLGILSGKLPAHIPLYGRSSYARAIEDIHTQVYTLVQTHMAASSPEQNLLNWVLPTNLVEKGTYADEKLLPYLRDQVTTLFVSGYETTYASLAWAFSLLASHPREMERLYAEVKSVDSSLDTFETLQALPYTRAVFREALRLYPPGWRITRKVLETDEIDGVSIPAGASVMLFIYGIQRHPEIWEQPDAFLPERWLENPVKMAHPLGWIPFGMGPRQCLGKDLAMLEGQIALAMIAQRFSLQWRGESKQGVQLATTLKPKGKLWVDLVAR
ncbi:MAG TPA: cytochrome P450, partial [Anaerolineales bacterium]|nr:cytochrome P450 [Anaerolineales bacterium]